MITGILAKIYIDTRLMIIINNHSKKFCLKWFYTHIYIQKKKTLRSDKRKKSFWLVSIIQCDTAGHSELSSIIILWRNLSKYHWIWENEWTNERTNERTSERARERERERERKEEKRGNCNQFVKLYINYDYR